jgi:hypothetical protein
MTKLTVLMLSFLDLRIFLFYLFIYIFHTCKEFIFLHQLGHMDSFHSTLSVSNVGFCFGWETNQSCQQPKEKNVKVVTPPSN